jgi:hypothetical protein
MVCRITGIQQFVFFFNMLVFVFVTLKIIRVNNYCLLKYKSLKLTYRKSKCSYLIVHMSLIE